MAKLYMWKCPAGEHSGVRAPGRPRKDDIRRFCLECSVKSGRLTERVAPAIEKKRERKAAAAKRKAATKARRAAKRAKVARVKNPTVWPDTLHNQWRALVHGDTSLNVLWDDDVQLVVRKSRARASSGSCRYKAKEVVITAGTLKPAARVQLVYQAARFVAYLGGRAKDKQAVADICYEVGRDLFGSKLEVKHPAEPDRIEVLHKLLVCFAEKEGNGGR